MPLDKDSSMLQLENEKTASITLETTEVLIKSEAASMDMQNSAMSQVHTYWTYLSIVYSFVILVVCSIFVWCPNEALWTKGQVLLFTMKHSVKMGESPVKQKSPLGGLFVILFVITAITLSIAQYLEFLFAGFDVHWHYMLNMQSKQPPIAKIELQIRAGGIPLGMCNNNSISLQLGSLFPSKPDAALGTCPFAAGDDYFHLCANALPCVQWEGNGVCSVRMCQKRDSVYNTRLFTVKYNTFVTALETNVRVSSALPDQTSSIRVQFRPKSQRGMYSTYSP